MISNLPFPVSNFYEALMSKNVKQKLVPFIEQLRKNNISNAEQDVASIVKVQRSYDNQIFVLPIIYQIATQKYLKRSQEGIQLYFVDRGSQNTRQMRRLGINYVQLATEFIFNSAKRTVKLLNSKGILDKQKCTYYIPSYPENTRKKFIKKLRHFTAQPYISFLISQFLQQLNQGKKCDLDVKKMLLFGDSFLVSTVVEIIEKELGKMQGNFMKKIKYLSLLNDLIKSGEIESIYLVNTSDFVRKIADEIGHVKGQLGLSQGEHIYPLAQASSQEKKDFYMYFLRVLEIWAHCIPIDQESNVLKAYNQLKQRNFVFPNNFLLDKIKIQVEQNLSLNSERNQTFMKMMDQDDRSSQSSEGSYVPSNLDFKSYFPSSQKSYTYVDIDDLHTKVYDIKKRIDGLALNEKQIKENIRLISSFVEGWEEDLEKLDLEHEDPHELEIVVDEGDACCEQYKRLLPIYQMFNNGEIKFLQFSRMVKDLQNQHGNSQLSSEKSLKKSFQNNNLQVSFQQALRNPKSSMFSQSSNKSTKDNLKVYNAHQDQFKQNQGSSPKTDDYMLIQESSINKQNSKRKSQIEIQQPKITQKDNHKHVSKQVHFHAEKQKQLPSNQSNYEQIFNDIKLQLIKAKQEKPYSLSTSSKKSLTNGNSNRPNHKKPQCTKFIINQSNGMNEYEINNKPNQSNQKAIQYTKKKFSIKRTEISQTRNSSNKRMQQSRHKLSSSKLSVKPMLNTMDSLKKKNSLSSQKFKKNQFSLDEYDLVRNNTDGRKSREVQVDDNFSYEDAFKRHDKCDDVMVESVISSQGESLIESRKEKERDKLERRQVFEIKVNSHSQYYPVTVPELKDYLVKQKNSINKSSNQLSPINKPQVNPLLNSKQSLKSIISRTSSHLTKEPNSNSDFKMCYASMDKEMLPQNSSKNRLAIDSFCSSSRGKSIVEFSKSSVNSNNSNEKSKVNNLLDAISEKNAEKSIQKYKLQREKNRNEENIYSKNHQPKVNNMLMKTRYAVRDQSLKKNLTSRQRTEPQARFNSPTVTSRYHFNHSPTPTSTYHISKLTSAKSYDKTKQKSQPKTQRYPTNSIQQPLHTGLSSITKNTTLINTKSYEQFFIHYSKPSTNKKLYKKKGLIIQNEEIEIGYLVSKKDKSVIVNMFITPFAGSVRNVLTEIQCDHSLVAKVKQQRISRIETQKQEMVTCSFTVNNLPFKLPIIRISFDPHHNYRKHSYTLGLPCTMLSFTQIQQPSQSPHEDSNNKVMRTQVFKLQKKLKSADKIRQIFPAFKQTKGREACSILSSIIKYQSHTYCMSVVLNSMGYAIVQGSNREKQFNNTKQLEYLVTTMKFLLQQGG